MNTDTLSISEMLAKAVHKITFCISAVFMRCCLLTFLTLAVSLGCQTYTEKIRPALDSYEMGRMESASDSLTEVMEGSNRHLVQLERGMANLALGNTIAAVRDFTEATAQMDDLLSDDDLLGSAASYVWDDTVRDYVGSPYEQICARLFLALAYMLMPGQFEKISAACRDMDIKMEQVEALYERLYRFDNNGNETDFAFQIPPLAKYMAALTAERRGELDNALIYMKQAMLSLPKNRYLENERERMKRGKNKNLVYVFALIGMGPRKVEVEYEELEWLVKGIRTAYAIAKPSADLDALTEAVLTAPVRIPAFTVRKPFWHGGYRVKRDGGSDEERTVSLADFDLYARQEYKSVFPGLVIRTVVRRLVKEGVGKAAGAAVAHNNKDEPWGGLLGQIAGDLLTLILTGIETIDTRSWCTLPREFHAACIEVQPDTRSIILEPIIPNGKPMGPEITIPIDTSSGDPAFIIVFHPTKCSKQLVVVDDTHECRFPDGDTLASGSEAPPESSEGTRLASSESSEPNLIRKGEGR